MLDSEENVNSAIFSCLKHQVRRKILKMLSEEPRSFSEMLQALEISSSHLTYHLENLDSFISKTEDGKYSLSEFGGVAVAAMNKIDKAPSVTKRRHIKFLPRKWKFSLVALVTALVVLSCVCFIQYYSLNQLSSEYEQIRELMELTKARDTSIQYEYTFKFFSTWKIDADTQPTQIVGLENMFCVAYNPYENSTLHLALSISRPPAFSIPLSVQKGNALNYMRNETLTKLWSVNTDESNHYSVHLPAKGWYTIGAAGPITLFYDESGRLVGHSFRLLNGNRGFLSLRIFYDKKYVPFAVAQR